MSNIHLQQKLKNSKRRLRTERAIKRQVAIAKQVGLDLGKPHKYHKMRALNCGNSNCYMCGNPRKFLNEKTIQEQRFDQTKNWFN